MVNFECSSYNGAIKVLEVKGLLGELNEVFDGVTTPLGTPTVRMISGLFARKGWALEVNLLEETDYRHDAFKEGVLVEIDLRGLLIDSVNIGGIPQKFP